MFTINPNVLIKVTKENIENLEADRTEIETKIASLLGTINVIKLGLAKDQDYSEIKEAITGKDGLIDQISTWINDAEQLSKLVLKFTPHLVGETTDEQNQWYLQNQDGWETVKSFMYKLGAELTDNIVEGENGELEVKRPERVAAILDEMTRIANIIAGKDIATNAQIDLDIKLKELDSTSFNEAMKTYAGYKEKIKEAAEEIQETALANQHILINSLKDLLEFDPDNEELKKKLEEAEAGLETIKANWDEAVQKSFEEMSEPGRLEFKEWLFNQFDTGSVMEPGDFEYWLQQNGLNATNLSEALTGIFKGAGMNMEGVDIGELLNVGGWDLLSADLQKKIRDNLGKLTPETVKYLKENLNLDASTIISMSGFSTLEAEERKELVTTLVNAFGSSKSIS